MEVSLLLAVPSKIGFRKKAVKLRTPSPFGALPLFKEEDTKGNFP